jgi:thiosulfate reductase cytochrome b subunit
MFGWLIGSLLVLWLVITLINKQYEIDQEDWDFREQGDE